MLLFYFEGSREKKSYCQVTFGPLIDEESWEKALLSGRRDLSGLVCLLLYAISILFVDISHLEKRPVKGLDEAMP
jgi:hypothetical protein